jgi:uncharacterized protein YndB with AHSA1/START domain
VTARETAALAVACATSLAGALADAAVSQVGSGGFVVRNEASVEAPAAKIYEALVHVASWWSSEHTYSGDAKNLSIEPRAGGCFCERLADGGGIEHARVVYVAPRRALRLAGALGPLQPQGVAGSLTWTLTQAEGGTKIELVYSVGGFLDGGFEKLAPLVDRVLGEQLQRLKTFAETGKPTLAQ